MLDVLPFSVLFFYPYSEQPSVTVYNKSLSSLLNAYLWTFSSFFKKNKKSSSFYSSTLGKTILWLDSVIIYRVEIYKSIINRSLLCKVSPAINKKFKLSRFIFFLSIFLNLYTRKLQYQHLMSVFRLKDNLCEFTTHTEFN